MSIHAVAQHIANKGRNGDSLLMHVTPGELHGLQQLAVAKGGTLTINPETGLPEASFLKDILPAILGIGAIAAAPFTGGASLALGAAVAGGSSMALNHGDLKKGLLTGLSVGLGGMLAPGLGALGAGLGAAGGAAAGAGVMTAEQLAMQGIRTAGGQAAQWGLNAGVGAAGRTAAQAAAQAATQAAAGNATQAAATAGGEALYGAGSNAARSAMANAVTPVGEQLAPTLARMQALGKVPYQQMNVLDRFGAIGKGIGNLAHNPGRAWEFAKANPYGTGAAVLGAGSLMGGWNRKTGGNPNLGAVENYDYDPGYDPSGAGGYYFRPQYTHTGTTRFATGGDIQYPQSQMPSSTYATPMQMPVPQEVVGAQDAGVAPYSGTEMLARGGLSSLGGYSDGGQLTRGPGDGVSDSIPASIDGQQPARLADGEFVVPARIVSEIGNGSTEAGSKKLYAMMDRISAARRKTKDIAANTRSERFMPA